MFKVTSFSRFVVPTLLLGVLFSLAVGWATAVHDANAEEDKANEQY